jgi:hypothetical protein
VYARLAGHDLQVWTSPARFSYGRPNPGSAKPVLKEEVAAVDTCGSEPCVPTLVGQ